MKSLVSQVIYAGAFLLIAALACKSASTPQPPTPTKEITSTFAPGSSGPTLTFPPGSTEPTLTFLPGDSEHSLTINGLQRSYVLHIPAGFNPAQQSALVLAFHGITLDAYEMIRISRFNEQSDEIGFLVAYPNAYGEQQSWNGGHCCGESAREQRDDLGFVQSVIADISSSLPVDPHKIYVTGFSNGAIFAYYLACELADQIAAIAPVSATQAQQDQEACHPSRPMPVIHFHGTEDVANPYNGGVTPGGVQFISVADEIQFWVNFNACPAAPQQSQTGSIFHEIYAPCQADAAVELYTIQGGKHAWPGGEAVNQRMGEPSMEISATALIWEFFTQHPLP